MLASRNGALIVALVASGCHRAPPRGPVADDDGAAPLAREVSLDPTWGRCGRFDCRQFDSPSEAFESALGGGPRVVAVGEAHAPKGTRVPSAASHFTAEILPILAGRASDLLVELLNPPTGCGETTAAVRQQQASVTATQAETDQSEYVAMGNRARQLGIVPDLLRPSCADLAAVRDAGDDAILASLELIARLTRAQVEPLVQRSERTAADRGKFVVTYGGALHVDPNPGPERAAISFGPALVAVTGGRYVAIDLFIPELIDDSDRWRRLPFYPFYDAAKQGAKTTVFRDGQSFVIVLPRTATE